LQLIRIVRRHPEIESIRFVRVRTKITSGDQDSPRSDINLVPGDSEAGRTGRTQGTGYVTLPEPGWGAGHIGRTARHDPIKPFL
jgi:hypothetical protein